LQSHFHIISTSRLMSWTTFQPRGSSSTIEDFSKQYSRTLKNYTKRLQDYSDCYSRLQCARGACWAYSPGTHARKEEDRLLLESPCNSTRTRFV
jgi:hypothetical protein